MKILDKYISSSVALAFISGVAIFMVLLCAMDLFKGFIELITEHDVAPTVAFGISAYRIPGMLVYAFPMAVLLGILLVFSRMSAESEMVAIRAAGVSFFRIALPAVAISLIVTVFTFLISNYYAPYASKQSAELESQALRKARADSVSFTQQNSNGDIVYSIQASHLEVNGENGNMKNVVVIYYSDSLPYVFVSAPKAEWDYVKGYWHFVGGRAIGLDDDLSGIKMQSGDESSFDLESSLFHLKVSPFRLSNVRKDPADMTSDEIRRQVREMKESGATPRDLGKWVTRLAQRYATPFACVVFALVGAPLGLRHHRTSSAVGFGLSLLVIFAFYFVSVYVTSFGDNGTIPPLVAAWIPNTLGAIIGIIFLIKANR